MWFFYIGVKEIFVICNECNINVFVYLLIKMVCIYDIKYILFLMRKDVRNYRNSYFNIVNVNELIFKFIKESRKFFYGLIINCFYLIWLI